MTRVPSRGIFIAGFFAALLHAALFIMVRPAGQSGAGSVPVSPNTRYLVRGGDDGFPMVGNDPRIVGSPVLFSLPSAMGFSRELREQDVLTRLTFSQPVESEQFLKANLIPDHDDLESQPLMLSALGSRSPALPLDIFQPQETRPSARRVTLAPELKERMVGGVVLPPELNQEVSSPWEVRAQISVSEEGAVKHVFLDQPLESAELNMRVLQLLHSLQFNPGPPIDGQVDLYSPESKPTPEVAP